MEQSEPSQGWSGARPSCSQPERGFGHLGAASGEPTRLREWKRGEAGVSNLQTVGFTKSPVSNLTGERHEDAEDALAFIRPCKIRGRYPGGNLGWESSRSCWRRFRGQMGSSRSPEQLN